MSKDDIGMWYERLAKLLKVQKLPCERGPARFADKDEFMLMQVSNDGKAARFKHNYTRNYVVVENDGSSLSVPVTQTPFLKGFFDVL